MFTMQMPLSTFATIRAAMIADLLHETPLRCGEVVDRGVLFVGTISYLCSGKYLRMLCGIHRHLCAHLITVLRIVVLEVCTFFFEMLKSVRLHFLQLFFPSLDVVVTQLLQPFVSMLSMIRCMLCSQFVAVRVTPLCTRSKAFVSMRPILLTLLLINLVPGLCQY